MNAITGLVSNDDTLVVLWHLGTRQMAWVEQAAQQTGSTIPVSDGLTHLPMMKDPSEDSLLLLTVKYKMPQDFCILKIILIFHVVLFLQAATIREIKLQSNSCSIKALQNIPVCCVCISIPPASLPRRPGKVLVSDTLSPEHYEYMHWFNAIAQTFLWAFTTVSNRVAVGKRQWENSLYLTQT